MVKIPIFWCFLMIFENVPIFWWFCKKVICNVKPWYYVSQIDIAGELSCICIYLGFPTEIPDFLMIFRKVILWKMMMLCKTPRFFFQFTKGTWLGLKSSASHEGECAIRHRRETFGKRPQSGIPEVWPVVGIGGLSLYACLYPKFPFCDFVKCLQD